MNIHHLLFINTEGEVKIIKPSKGAKNPAHLSIDDLTGYRVLHHMEPIDDMPDFMEQYYWNGTGWTHRGPKPNLGATWSIEQDNWDKNDSYLLKELRTRRSRKLYESDWSVIVDSPLTAEQQAEAKTYRTALRDLPATLDMTAISSIDDVTWPTKPEFL